MSASADLEAAIWLLGQGRRAEATALLMILQDRVKDPQGRLRLIDASLSAMDNLRQNGLLLELSSEGIGIAAQAGQRDLQAHFMGRRSDLLTVKLAFLQRERAMLKLAPKWIGFAIEADESAYRSLTAEYEALQKAVDDLLVKAIEIAENLGDPRVLASVLTSRGSAVSARYMRYKADCLRRPLPARLWSFQLLRYPLFERFIVFGPAHGRELSNLVSSFTADYLHAGALLEGIGDGGAASAYYNLANQLRTAYRFRRAFRHLRKARGIALGHGDQPLIGQCDRLRSIIKKRNRDTPDYLSGERRQAP
jgi:hypothetical protein